ncbi:RNA/RNP complex-1-interacting phosphatase isoform X14 [Sylvia atricapilla]|uniref:RNA/RNP complex-1-interacting phosphatase isoform X14 n=1 Tax=Sylvia atricapilla TaxID=48155 RepID=UPI003393BB11
MAGGRGALRVPERWTDYIPLGCRMPGTRFIAFKVPLKKSFDQNLLPEERFSPRDLIRKVEERKEELGLIIDLTYTTRYYGREDLPPTLRYTKIVTMGHKIPNKKTISMFRYMVKKFLTRNKDNDKLIGVHCTHGLNRTGYLVCRYLIDVEGMEPNAAIELFNKSRGHPIERINYIRDLQKRALKNSCEPKNSGSDVFREKGSAPAKPQKQLVKHHPSQAPLAVPRFPCRSPSSTKEQRPDPRAQGQPQELGHGHRALGQRQQEHLEQRHLEQKKLERRQQKKLKQLEQNHLEQRQQKKMKHQEQRQLEEQHHLEQRQQKKLKYQEQNHEEQRQQKKVKYLEQNHLEQRQLEEQNHLEQRQQKKLKHLEQNHLEPNHQEQRQKKMKHLEQNHLEQRQLEEQHHLEQREQKKLKHLEQNHQEQRQQKKLKHQEQRQQKKLKHQEQRQLEEQHPVEQRQPCSSAPRNCWLPQELSPARKRRRRKHELKEQEMS